MNRVIKFRGKRLDNGKWVYGYLADEDYINNINEVAMPSEEVDSNSVGQFTGLKDRNGKEIYEGDIITVGGNCHRVIHWNKVSWAMIPCELYNDMHLWRMNIQHPGEYWEEFADEMEVVGNIYDNPEFLKSNSK